MEVEIDSSEVEATGGEVANEVMVHMRAKTLSRMTKGPYVRDFELYMLSTGVCRG
jgi:hypothetical protein